MVYGTIDVADGVQSDLHWILDKELDVPHGEPILAVCAAEGVHAVTASLQTQEDSA
jgi:hypothetical protein